MDEELKGLIDEIQKYDKNADINLIAKAYHMSKEAHKGQKRLSGDEYFYHPIGVAKILLELKADSETICAALLHDVVEESAVTLQDIERELNPQIALLVEGETKVSKVSFDSPEDYTAENLRKILLATIKDTRVIFIKLADRLHNMRTLKYFREDKQKRISRETLEIFAPIAHKLGLYSIKGELEDLSLRYLEPEVYQDIKSKINAKRKIREEKAEILMSVIKENLTKQEIDFYEVSGRAKYFYSIYKKMIQEKKSFDEIYDLIAIRIIVKTIPDCYRVLALVHQIWKPIPGRFKDYIAVPKSNGYQSLHTDVATNIGVILEVQIRTMEMHNVAKYGVAAHWRYKGTERDKMFDRRIAWLEQVIDWKKSADSDFLESLKIDLFQDEIVVFTPKGDPIILPLGATPIDFAFEVHSSIGIHCVKADVNGKLVSLDTKLKSGDIVNILTQNNAKPSRNWLSFAMTSKAKQKIRSELKIDSEKDPKQQRLDDEQDHTGNLAKFIGYSGKKYPVKISKCCSPALKEDIVAFLTKDKAITVHKTSCPNIHTLDPSKKVEVHWNIADKQLHTFRVYVNDKLGMVKSILGRLTENRINVLSVNIKPHKKSILVTLQINMDASDNPERILKMLKELKDVLTVTVDKNAPAQQGTV